MHVRYLALKAGWPAILEFLELFLNFPWKTRFSRQCSWNVLDFFCLLII